MDGAEISNLYVNRFDVSASMNVSGESSQNSIFPFFNIFVFILYPGGPCLSVGGSSLVWAETVFFFMLFSIQFSFFLSFYPFS